MAFSKGDRIAHKEFDITMDILSIVDTPYCGGYTQANYICKQLLPNCYTKPLISLCDKHYIEMEWTKV